MSGSLLCQTRPSAATSPGTGWPCPSSTETALNVPLATLTWSGRSDGTVPDWSAPREMTGASAGVGGGVGVGVTVAAESA